MILIDTSNETMNGLAHCILVLIRYRQMLPINIYADIYFRAWGLNCCQCLYLHLNIVFVSSKGL